ncbi:CDP-glycerol glycerophosphotransferase family protein [Pantoea sp. RIT-PI-b]|uniref:CDP-glycerol glycerophosphotransferase family protein n=1 Tax=Pantoea sp. RIT-PI-b TaxID=1681195 RepID=UPI000AB380EB|nr:CDP-glycerol glycerophosphotransferase family protein [Pantoea sp. RIT-PI-b]
MSSTTLNKGPAVGFFMETSFHYDVYRNIILKLLDSKISCEIIINDLIEDDFVKSMLGFLRTVKVKKLTCSLLSTVIKQSKTYLCFVSPYHLHYAQDMARVHIRTVYGLAKNEWNHAEWNKKYHSILCYSHYTEKSLNLPERVKVVGNPRFDDWHNKTYSQNIPDNLKLSATKPTLLYAPTYGDLSSLPHWAERLSRLSTDYNVITKLHHATLYKASERQALKTAKRFLKRIVVDNSATFALLKHADYVISDNSGFIFDAINADKKIILLDWEGMGDLLKDNKSYSNHHSPEQQVRQFLPVARDMPDIRHYLSDEYPWRNNIDTLQNIKTEYCDAFNDGSAGMRAAQVIVDAIKALD